jgi:hypothetical protein
MRSSLPLLLIAFGCAAAPRGEIRSVRENVLTSRELPAIAITVSSDFEYAGRFPFTIGGIAAGERYVFVDVEEGRVRRTIIAQFESFLPSSGETYRYDFSKAMDWGGFRFRDNTFAYNEPAYSRDHPGNEAALTASFLRQRGLDVPDEWLVSRFVTLGDETRKHELILFYAEDLESTGVTLDELYSGDEATERWTRMRAKLRERSLKAISVRKLD